MICLEDLEEFMELPELNESSGIVYTGQEKKLTDEQSERLIAVLTAVWRSPERHALALSSAGTLAKSGYTMQEACNLISRVCLKAGEDRKSTRLNSSHSQSSYAVF